MKEVKLLIVCFLLACSTYAQQYYFNSFGVKEGLIQSNTTCGIQASNGYLWLGTESGLSKFDGKKFINYTKDDGLVESSISAIFEDNLNRIWIGHTNGGVSIIENNKIRSFSDSVFTKTISTISEDGDGNIWIATLGEGAVKFNPDSNSTLVNYKRYLGKQGLGDYIFQIFIDSESKIWFVTDVGLKSFKSTTEEFEFEKIEGLPPFQITSILKDIDRNLWIGTYQGGLYKYNQTTKSLNKYSTVNGLAGNWISCITQKKDKSIWIGTWGGGVSKIQNDEIISYKEINGLNDEKIRFLLEDREGNIVIGTNEHGFSIYSGDKFSLFSSKNGLSDNQVWALESINNSIYIGHNYGIDILSDNGVLTKLNGFEFPVRSFCTINNNLFIGTWGHGIFKWNKGMKKPQPLNEVNLTVSNNINHITSFNNHIYISTIKGFTKYNATTKEITSFNGIIGKVELDVTSSKIIDAENIYIGTRKNGLVFYDGNSFNKLCEGEIIAPPSSFSFNDKTNKLYVGTEGAGVYVIENEKVVDKINVKNNQILSDFILGVFYTGKNLYFTTNKGIVKLNLENNKVQNYNEFDGFTPIESKLNSLLLKNENLYIGTVGGLSVLKTQLNADNKVPNKINISNIKINLKDTLLQNGAELSYKNNSIRFDFDAICLTNNTNIKYQVKLNGWDDWHFVDNTQINYSNIPEGEYTLQIKTSNNSGVWNEQPYEFSFTINPPFYRTWWFYLLSVIVLISFIVIFIKVREKQLINEKKVLEQKVEERTIEVVEKSNDLEKALSHIQSSIVYAQRIQNAILPSEEYIKKNLPQSFVFFKPRDIVSGDFYWMERSGDEILFSAIDCTGHGVPGAFVSMVGHNLLNQSVRKHKFTKPSDILDDLHNEVKHTLQSNDNSSVKDGMDLALCNYNSKTKVLQYAGAHNSLYHIRNGELIEYKADRFAIGYKGLNDEKKFVNNTIDILEGDSIYIFTDGFVDQFGGDKGRKYMSKNFKNFVLNQIELPVEEQKESFNKELTRWMTGNYKQIDDILIWGVKF